MRWGSGGKMKLNVWGILFLRIYLRNLSQMKRVPLYLLKLNALISSSKKDPLLFLNACHLFECLINCTGVRWGFFPPLAFPLCEGNVAIKCDCSELVQDIAVRVKIKGQGHLYLYWIFSFLFCPHAMYYYNPCFGKWTARKAKGERKRIIIFLWIL